MIELPSGAMIQFGHFGSPGTGGYAKAQQRITFARPFPTGCVSAVQSNMWTRDNTWAPIWDAIVTCDRFGITFGASVTGRHWQAIGY
ncbi:gp53-like domain-containing protein [Stutzerimonas frequens]